MVWIGNVLPPETAQVPLSESSLVLKHCSAAILVWHPSSVGKNTPHILYKLRNVLGHSGSHNRSNLTPVRATSKYWHRLCSCPHRFMPTLFKICWFAHICEVTDTQLKLPLCRLMLHATTNLHWSQK